MNRHWSGMLAAAVMSLCLASRASAWVPRGWVYLDWPYAYASADETWRYLSEADSQYAFSFCTSQWERWGTVLREGWVYFMGPYAYDTTAGCWSYFSTADTQYALSMRTVRWSRLFAPGPEVLLGTTKGEIRLELWPDAAPVTCSNFARYVEDHHFDGTIFHRVIVDFMIQGGHYDTNLVGQAVHAAIVNEASNGCRNVVGALAMARSQDPNSATDQFYINTINNPHLDYGYNGGAGYCVFGAVVDGMSVVRAIEDVETETVSASFKNVPIEDVIITNAVMAVP